MRGLRLGEEAVLTQDPNRLAEHYSVGMNANMCESLMEIAELATDREAEFSVQWSPRVTPLYSDVRVKVGAKWRSVMAAASSHLRQVPLLKRVSVLGKIVALRSESVPAEDGDPENHVVHIESREPGRRMTVRVSLSAIDYRKACDAHRDGQSVSVRGVVEKQGKHWVLCSPSHFQVVSPERLLLSE